MIYQTLKLAVQYLVETQLVAEDRFSAVYQYAHKRLVKKGVNSVTYELSDSKKITITRDTTTYQYSVEVIITPASIPVVQSTELEPVSVYADPVQLSLNLTFEVDSVKAEEYARKHQKVRRPRLVVDNTYKPQLSFDFDTPKINNVVDFPNVSRKRQIKVQQCDWGQQYVFV